MANRAYSRPYVGRSRATGRLETFRSVAVPTEQSHGQAYGYAIGPFRTARGARFMARFGGDNPHCVTVGDAERIAAKEA